MATQQTIKPLPVAKVRDRGIEIAIWRNTGTNGVFYSTTVKNSYKDEHEEYHDSDNYSENDLLRLRRLTDKAYDAISELRAADRAEQKRSA